jgi:Protein of unknown function (DUF3617)
LHLTFFTARPDSIAAQSLIHKTNPSRSELHANAMINRAGRDAGWHEAGLSGYSPAGRQAHSMTSNEGDFSNDLDDRWFFADYQTLFRRAQFHVGRSQEQTGSGSMPTTPTRLAPLLIAIAVPSLIHAQTPVVQPGQWEMAVTVNTVDMPGAPPMVANMMRGRTTTIKHCITPDEALRGPQEAMKSNKSCAFTRYTAAGGKLSSEMVCKQGGGTMTVVTSGTFTPTSFAATGQSVMTGRANMTMTTTSTGRRVGECG